MMGNEAFLRFIEVDVANRFASFLVRFSPRILFSRGWIGEALDH